MRSISSAAKPRSVLGAYAVRVDYWPEEDRLTLTYSVPDPVRPLNRVAVEEDPLEGLRVDPDFPVEEILKDIPITRKLLQIPPRDEAAIATAALDRVVGMLEELDSLL